VHPANLPHNRLWTDRIATRPDGQTAGVSLSLDAASRTTAVRDISNRVRERLRAEQIEPSRHPDRAGRLALDEVRRHNDYALARGGDIVDDEAACVRDVMATVSGYGALQPLLDDPTVEEIWINAPDRVFCARGGRNERVRLALTAEAVRDLVERMLHATGRRVDLSHPFVDASLPDGSRLHVVIPDITREHWSVNIRKFLPHRRSLDDLVAGGAMPSQVAALLRGVMMEGSNVLVSGATHAGKTTLLGALLAACPESERIVTVEETFELALPSSDVIALQGRQPSLEGTGEVTLRRLVKEALRMRPDRLVVGEVRDAEALDLLLALNTGVPGAATIHANSAGEAVRKLASLALLAGRSIDTAFVLPAVASAVHVVVHCTRAADGRRVVSEIARTTGEIVEGTVGTHSLYQARSA
jgi:pilus assembly protein CpaF